MMQYQVFPSQNLHAEYVVLSSGLGGHGQFWTPQIEALQQHFHVVIYDQEGCHKNAAILDENYTMTHLAKQVVDLLAILNIHTFVEAKKLAFEDRAKFYADPEFNKLPIS